MILGITNGMSHILTIIGKVGLFELHFTKGCLQRGVVTVNSNNHHGYLLYDDHLAILLLGEPCQQL